MPIKMKAKRDRESDKSAAKINAEHSSDDISSDSEAPVRLPARPQHATDSQSQPPSAKRHKPNEKEKFPTAEERIYINETTDLYHSHIFRVKMEEMLKNISMKHKHKHQLESWLTSFQKFLCDIPCTEEPVDLQDWSPYSAAGVTLPLSALPRVVGDFRFAPPVSTAFTGSFSDGTVTTQNLVLDVMIQMPRSCVSVKDCRDGRWLLKRAHYLGHLAAALQQCPLVQQEKTSWTLHLGEPLRPTLLVSPKLTGGVSKWKVQLLPVPCEGTFKCHTFSPPKVNVKNKGALPCPGLNFMCAVDAEMALSNSSLQTQLRTLPGLVDGIKLAKVWLNQRQLYKGRGALSGHVLSQLVLHLFRIRRVFAQSSGYQVFRLILAYLDDSNWTESGINMFDECQKGKNIKENPFANTLIDTAAYKLLYPAVIVGPTGYCNLAATLTPQYCKQLKQEVKHGLQTLLSNENTFDFLFILRANFDLIFDQSIHVKIKRSALQHFYSSNKPSTKGLLLNQLHPSVLGETTSNDSGVESNEEDQCPVGDTTNSIMGDPGLMIPELGALLETGLGPRATIVVPKLVPAPVWGVGEPIPDANATVTFGLRLDPSSAWNLLIKNEDGGSDVTFQEFWGEMCQLRRYRDGTECETVVWGDGSEGAGDCRKIPGRIVQHLLKRHFKIPHKDVHVVGPQLENLLRLPDEFEVSKEYCTGEASCVAAVQAYDALCRQLRISDAADTVLRVANIVSSDPALAHGAVFPRQLIDPTLTAMEQIRKALELCDPIEVLVFMERSGKWPDDLQAVEHVRFSLHAALIKELRKKRVAVMCDRRHLLVVMQGYAFRLRVTYQGEVLLLRQAISPEFHAADEEQLSQYDTKASLQLQVQTTVTHRIVTALAGLGGLHSSYGPAVRMCRRWLSGVMLEPHMPALATQLLVAHLYTSPGQFQVPSTPSVAFLRFLTILATARFEQTPFFVNLNGEFLDEDLKELQNCFDTPSSRELLPFLFIATPFDIRGGAAKLKDAGGVQGLDSAEKFFRYKLVSHCTQERPLKVMISFLKGVAAAALEICQSMMYERHFNLLAFCKPARFMYNIVVELDPRKLACLEENLNYGRLKPKAVHSTATPGKPVKKKEQLHTTATKQYIRDMVQFMEKRYQDHSIVHYDPLGGDIVTFAFIPGALDEKIYPKGDVGPEYELLTSSPPYRARLDPHMIAGEIKVLFASVVKSVSVNVTQ